MNRRALLLSSALGIAILVRLVDPWPSRANVPIAQVSRHAAHALDQPNKDLTPTPSEEAYSARVNRDHEIIDIFAPSAPSPVPMPSEVDVAASLAAQKASASAAAHPPAPVAPPFPYTVVGDWTEGGVTQVFLSGGTGLISAKAGDILPGGYKVEELGRGNMKISFMPLQQSQQLSWISNQ